MFDDNLIINNYFDRLQEYTKLLDKQKILSLVDKIDQVRQNNGTVFLAGNGGSATTASHFVADLGVGSLLRKNPTKAISLTENTAVITAVSNDQAYLNVFERQLELLGCSRDLLVVISASGNSQNIIQAIKRAEILGMQIFSLTGFDGGEVKNLTQDFNIHVDTPAGHYGLVEDIHLAICHVVSECIRAR
jgi:D-sedoheptulose 7-phosphate isomerase